MVLNLLDSPVDSPRREEIVQRTETGPPPLPDRRHEEDVPERRTSARQNTSTWLLPFAIGGSLLYLFFVAAVLAVVAVAYFTMSYQIDILGR
jgi:hypothetical protein